MLLPRPPSGTSTANLSSTRTGKKATRSSSGSNSRALSYTRRLRKYALVSGLAAGIWLAVHALVAQRQSSDYHHPPDQHHPRAGGTTRWEGVYTTRDYRDAAICRFTVPSDPLPVHHEKAKIHFHNLPNSVHRPSNQFADPCGPSHSRQTEDREPVAITLITATQDPNELFEDTVSNVLSQSLQSFRWIIVDDHSTNTTSLERLERVSGRDPRIHLIRNTDEPGLVHSRNFALDHIKRSKHLQSPYVSMLDDDDLFELTTLEKAVWMLESNPNWSIASFQFAKFGHRNDTVTRGPHSGIANYALVGRYPSIARVLHRAISFHTHPLPLWGPILCASHPLPPSSARLYSQENFMANTAVIRYEDIGTCRYDPAFIMGGEDWDFWLCMAKEGHWGGTLPEIAYW